MSGSYFIPIEKLAGYTDTLEMNAEEGIFLFGLAEPSIKSFLPPPLELPDPENPLFYLYIVNIREPSFAPWYMEGGIGVIAQYGNQAGMYFFSLMLSGPGALMGMFAGRESCGLPKKLCERIVVERTNEHGHCFIERNGVRLVDVELEIGQYNIPDYRLDQERATELPEGVAIGGGCLQHRYLLEKGGGAQNMDLVFIDSPTRYYSWEPATAQLKLCSSIDDPYGEIPLTSVIGAAWSKCDNTIEKVSSLYSYPQDDADEVMQYLFAGRFDQSLLGREHQRYSS